MQERAQVRQRAYATAPISLSAADALECPYKNLPAMRPFVKLL